MEFLKVKHSGKTTGTVSLHLLNQYVTAINLILEPGECVFIKKDPITVSVQIQQKKGNVVVEEVNELPEDVSLYQRYLDNFNQITSNEYEVKIKWPSFVVEEKENKNSKKEENKTPIPHSLQEEGLVLDEMQEEDDEDLGEEEFDNFIEQEEEGEEAEDEEEESGENSEEENGTTEGEEITLVLEEAEQGVKEYTTKKKKKKKKSKKPGKPGRPRKRGRKPAKKPIGRPPKKKNNNNKPKNNDEGGEQ